MMLSFCQNIWEDWGLWKDSQAYNGNGIRKEPDEIWPLGILSKAPFLSHSIESLGVIGQVEAESTPMDFQRKKGSL